MIRSASALLLIASVLVFSVSPLCGSQEGTKQETEANKTEVKPAEPPEAEKQDTEKKEAEKKKEEAVDEQAAEQARIESRDFVRRLQEQAFRDQKSELGYWGVDPANYFGWKSHSNRLIPVYTFGTKGAGSGVDLSSWTADNSPYRSETSLARIYGYVPEHSVDPQATWMDQTNIYDLQMEGIAAGKKYIFLVVFDGMDWQSTQAAGIYNSGRVYTEGKGHGTFFQEYDAGGTAQFGWMVTSPHNDGTDVDPSAQTVVNPGGKTRGGYHSAAGGVTPWSRPSDLGYLIGKPAEGNPTHAYTDSSSSASSMTAGAKLFNGAINVDPSGNPITTIAHRLQDEGISVGAISSVPISHATPAAAYAHNVSRDDYQDLTRDMLGLPSVQHPKTPLSGMDVVIGGGWGVIKKDGKDQGDNFVPGNVFLTDADLHAVDVRNGGKYITAVRTPGMNGHDQLAAAAKDAVQGKHRLLGFFGNGAYNGHLPFATADGQFDPVEGVNKKREKYRPADIHENPTLSQMTEAGIEVLSQNPKGFWLLVEPGDVDWANHDDNVDASIGAVNSGDAAVRVIANWVEQNSNWQESLMIVTADHGHLFNLEKPELLLRSSHPESSDPGN